MQTKLPGMRLRGEASVPREPLEVPSVDASTGEQVATVLGGGAADAAAVVDAAAGALDAWRVLPGAERAAVLRRLAASFREAAGGELPRVVSRETGKRLVEAQTEVRFSAQYFDLYARLAEDGSQPWWPSAGGGHLVQRRGIGVAAVVTPWNFPVSIPARKIAPALAAGCTVAWKPSEVAPASSVLVAELIDAEVPAGVAGMVLGAPAATTADWLDDPRVGVLSFTGSTRVGRIIAERAAVTFTRTVLELGGQAPFVVLDDADIDAANACLLVAKFRNSGHSCIAANRAWVPRALLDDLAAAFDTRLRAMRVGDPLDVATDLGPLALPGDPHRLDGLVADAESRGYLVEAIKAYRTSRQRESMRKYVTALPDREDRRHALHRGREQPPIPDDAEAPRTLGHEDVSAREEADGPRMLQPFRDVHDAERVVCASIDLVLRHRCRSRGQQHFPVGGEAAD